MFIPSGIASVSLKSPGQIVNGFRISRCPVILRSGRLHAKLHMIIGKATAGGNISHGGLPIHVNIFDRLKSVSGGGVDVERLLLEVLLQSADAAHRQVAIASSVHEANAPHSHATHTAHASHTHAYAAHAAALLHHRLFPFAHQAEHAEYEAGGQGGSNAAQSGEHAAGQLQKLPGGTALLLGLIEAAGAVVMTCKWSHKRGS